MIERNFDVFDVKLPRYCYSDRAHDAINTIVLHCFGCSLEEVFVIFIKSGLSAHYIVPQLSARDFAKDEMPKLCQIIGQDWIIPNLRFPDRVPVLRLMDDEKRGFHAGISHFAALNNYPGCSVGLNEISLGIEFHAPGYAKGDGSDWYAFVPYTHAQIQTGIELIAYLASTYAIEPHRVLAHSTIAVGRKTDPGPMFDWQALHQKGLTYMPPKFLKHSEINAANTPLEIKSDVILAMQEKLRAIGFIQCPQHGILDEAMNNHIDAYILQFAPDLWVHRHNDISEALLHSIEAFEV